MEMLRVAQAPWVEEVRRVAFGVRRRVLEHTIRQNGGYLSQACSAAELLATLYVRVMRLGASEAPVLPLPFSGVPRVGVPRARIGAAYNGPCAPDLDRFVLSPAHYALVLYATLIEVGRMAADGLAQFNQDGSTVEMIGAEHSPGMELTTGSLGQALSQAGGIALARRLRGEGGRVWVMMSDGEFQSGQTWEALQALVFHGVDSIGVYVDVNGQQCDGCMAEVMGVEPLHERIAAFGAQCVRVNGHDPVALAGAAEGGVVGRPLVVLADTDPCAGLDVLRERAPQLHYVRFRGEEERQRYADVFARMPQG